MAGLAEPDGVGRGREELLGIDDLVEHAHHFIPKAVHDRQGNAEDIGIALFVEVKIFDVELADSSVERAFPPGTVGMGEAGFGRQGGKEVSLHIRDEQLLGGGAHDLRQELVRFALRAGVKTLHEKGGGIFGRQE